MDPLRAALGDRLAGVFAETTPAKTLGTAARAAERAADLDADVLVGLGGGSSLDVAKHAAVLAAADRPPTEAAREMVAAGAVTVPDGALPPIVAVPTTLAGADLSTVAGTRLAMDPDAADGAPSGGVGDERLMPAAAVADAALFETTPDRVLANSAMNGFDKGVEMVYARDHTAVTDATATHGLRLLRRGLPALGLDGDGRDADDGADGDPTGGPDDPAADVARGIVLVQYGLSTGSAYRASLIHAFGHGFARRYEATQGVIHAILAPHVLEYLFREVDGRRALLARALDVDADAADPAAQAAGIVDAVAAVRDAMGLPDRLRAVDGLDPAQFPSIADDVLADSFMTNVPPGLDADRDAVVDVLEAAW
jgi:alcohol dehydrogenase